MACVTACGAGRGIATGFAAVNDGNSRVVESSKLDSKSGRETGLGVSDMVKTLTPDMCR